MKVCHVLNVVGPTTGPANHAVALQKYTDVEAGLLAWFERRPFDEEERLTDIACLDAPRTGLGIDRDTYRRAHEVLSRYDVVHAHNAHSGSLAKWIGWRQDKTIVSSEGGNHGNFTRKGRIANGLTNALADRVTCVSPSVRDSFRRWEKIMLDDRRIQIVYTGVDQEKIARRESIDWSVREEVPIDEDAFIVSTAGRLAPVKNYDDLIEGVAAANGDMDREIVLVIAGDGEQREHLERVRDRVGAEAHVHFLGLIERLETYRLMDQSDLFSMPSRWEGFNSAVLEAMAVGTPCLLSDIPAFREPFGDAAVYHTAGDVQELTRALKEGVQHPQRLHEKSTCAGKLVERRYTMRQTAEEYRDIYEELVRKRAQVEERGSFQGQR